MAQQVFPPPPDGELDAPTSSASIDAELVLLSLRGNREAFAALFDRHAPRVYAVAHGLVGERTEAEDITQDAFVQALSALPTLRQPELFGAWVARIATNTALNVLRRRGRLPRVEFDAAVADSYADTARWSSPEAMGLAADDQHAVRTTLNRLAPSHRAALTLREVGGLSYAEIAQALGTTPSGVETLLFRARARFRDEYAKVALGAARRVSTTCRQAQGALAALADGELAKSRRDVVVAHVRTCNACATTLQEQREAHRLLVAMPMVIPTSLKLATLGKVGPLLAGHAAAASATVAGVAGGTAVAGGAAAGSAAAGGVAASAAAGTTAAGAAAGSAAAGAALTGSTAASGAAVASAGAVSATIAGATTVGSVTAGAASLVTGATTGASALMGSITAGATSLASSMAAGASTLLTPAVVGAGATGAVAKATAVIVTGALVTGILITKPPEPSVSKHIVRPAQTAIPGQRRFPLPIALPHPRTARASASPLRQPAGQQRGAAAYPIPRSHGSVGETARHIILRASSHTPWLSSPMLSGSVAHGVPFATAIIQAQPRLVGAHGQRPTPSATPVHVMGAPASSGTAVAAPPIQGLSPTVQPVAAATGAPAGSQAPGRGAAELTMHAPSYGGTILAAATRVSTPTAAPPTVAVVALASGAAPAPIPTTEPTTSPSLSAHAPGGGATQPAPTPTPLQVVELTSQGSSGSVHPAPNTAAGSGTPTPPPMGDGPLSPPSLGQAASGGTAAVAPPTVSSADTSTAVISAAVVGDGAAPTAVAGGLPSLPTTGLAGLSDLGAVTTSLDAIPTSAPSGNETGLQSSATPTAAPSDTPTMPTGTPTDVPIDRPTDTATPSDTATDTAAPTDSPTDTATSTPSPTVTAVPTDTPTDTATSSSSTPARLDSMPQVGTCVPPTDTPPSADLTGASANGDPSGAVPTATGTATAPLACAPTGAQPAAVPTDQSGIVGGEPADGTATAQAIDPGGSGDVPPTVMANSPGASNDAAPTATATMIADAHPVATIPTAASITLAGVGDGRAMEIVAGAGFVQGEAVALSWNGAPAGGVTIAPDGTFALTVDAPPAGTGSVALLAEGGGDQAMATASF